MNRRKTEQEILAAAAEFIQLRGYNAFSFHDIAKQIGIRAPSIHYYFPSKSDLGLTLLTERRRALGEQAARIEHQGAAPRRKLESYVQMVRQTLGDGTRISLCGMLSAEYNTLPEGMRQELRLLLADAEAWTAKILEEGRAEGSLTFSGTSRVAASALCAVFQGAALSARVFHDDEHLVRVGQWLLDAMLPATDRAPATVPATAVG